MNIVVVIPTKNPGKLFQEVLRSVLAQKTDFPFDVLVIDSGSTDGTLEYLDSLGDPRVRLHRIDPGSFGHGRTRNLAISMVSGKYIALLTHDALPVDDIWLSELVAVAEKDPDIAGVFGRHIAYPEADPFTRQELNLHFKGLAEHPLVWLDDPVRYGAEAGYRQLLHFFSDNNALIRRSVWEQQPYPDVDFAEDQIWAQRIIEAGYKKAYAEKAVVYHSHDYSLLERLRRSYDEAYAFRRLFGYVLCGNSRSFFLSWLALTKRDMAYALSAALWRDNFIDVAKSPFDNFMRLVGHFLGSRGEKIPSALRIFLSHDKRLLLGLRNADGKAHK